MLGYRMSQDSRSKSGRRTLTHHEHLWVCWSTRESCPTGFKLKEVASARGGFVEGLFCQWVLAFPPPKKIADLPTPTPPRWWGWKLCLDHDWITMTVRDAVWHVPRCHIHDTVARAMARAVACHGTFFFEKNDNSWHVPPLMLCPRQTSWTQATAAAPIVSDVGNFPRVLVQCKALAHLNLSGNGIGRATEGGRLRASWCGQDWSSFVDTFHWCVVLS